jgi:hypothetical protein
LKNYHFSIGQITVTHNEWTQAGRMFIYNLLKQNDVLPLAEADRVNKAM